MRSGNRKIRFLAKKGQPDIDLNIELAMDCLQQRERVQIAVVFRGRSELDLGEGRDILNYVIEALVPEYGRLPSAPEEQDRRILCTILPNTA